MAHVKLRGIFMISNTLFITYTIMCFLGLQGVTLTLIIIKHNVSVNDKLLRATRNFAIVSLALGLFYYITYYRELVLGHFEANFLLRGLDAIVFYAMGHAWVKLVDAIIDSPNPKLLWWRKYTNKVFALLMILSATVYITLVDEYYTTDSFWAECFMIFSEILMGATVIIFTLAYVILGYKDMTDKNSKRYIVIVSIFVNFNNLWNNTVVIAVFIRQIALTMWCTKLYGITSILLLVINLLTLLYIYKKDFSPIYFEQNKDRANTITEEEAMDFVAQEFRLTERERDVMVLAYRGMTNPSIAEELFISKYTVKRHMHNIFEKLDVSARAELIHLIKSRTALK